MDGVSTVREISPFVGRTRLEMEGGRRPAVPRWFVPFMLSRVVEVGRRRTRGGQELTSSPS